MTSQTPAELEAEHAEQVENLIYAVEGPFARDDYEAVHEALAAPLAAIRRHAAATALHEQAKTLRAQASVYMLRAAKDVPGADQWTVCLRSAARSLDSAADDVIAEGWEHTCAQTTPATREYPAEGCETPVENEGEYCERHEAADDYDPREDD